MLAAIRFGNASHLSARRGRTDFVRPSRDTTRADICIDLELRSVGQLVETIAHGTGARRRPAGRRGADTRRLARRGPVRSHRAAPRRHRVVDVDGLAAPRNQRNMFENAEAANRVVAWSSPTWPRSRTAEGRRFWKPPPFSTRERRNGSHTVICGMRPRGRLRFVVHRSPITSAGLCC